MINRICGDSKDCAFGRQTNPANPCIIRSSLETLNMLPGESNGENAAAGERRSRAEIVSHIQEASITRAPARSSKNLLRWILLMRAAIRERRSVEGREKMVIRRQNAEKGTRVPFERSCLLLIFDVSEEIMPRGMWPVHLSRVSESMHVWINAYSILIHNVVRRVQTTQQLYVPSLWKCVSL